MQVYEHLLDAIVQKKYAYGEYLPSERSLAGKFEVDRLTVRKSLDMLVSEGLVEKLPGRGSRVRDLPYARPEAAEDTRSLTFIMPELPGSADRLTEPFNTRLFHRIQADAKRLGYMLAYTTVGTHESLERVFENRRPSGIVFVSEVETRFFEEAYRLEIPAVSINKDNPYSISVLSDRERGSYLQTQHLIELGHRNIALLNGQPSYHTAELSLQGFYRALSEHNLDPDLQTVTHGNWTFDSGFRAMMHIMENGTSIPTAVAASNDMIALGACEAIRSAGLRVPQDISVVGFDDIDQLEYFSPKLTTINSNIDLIATTAWNALYGSIMNRPSSGVRAFVPTSLVRRESTDTPRDEEG